MPFYQIHLKPKGPVVQRVDNFIKRIKCRIGWSTLYLLDSDLSTGSLNKWARTTNFSEEEKLLLAELELGQQLPEIEDEGYDNSNLKINERSSFSIILYAAKLFTNYFF